jgi:tetratricopeptide (TPR) repeat protein
MPRRSERGKRAAVAKWAAIFAFALTTAIPAQPAPQNGPPLTVQQIDGLLKGGVYPDRIAKVVRERGISFKPTEEYLQRLRQLGADATLVEAVRAEARFAKPMPSPGSAVARSLALARQLEQQRDWTVAEQEYRAALRQAPHDPEAIAGLGRVLYSENKLEDAIDEYRQAILLRPQIAAVHAELGDALAEKGDLKGAIEEYNTTLRLNPKDLDACKKLAATYYRTGQLGSAILEYRSLARMQPNNPEIHYRLGLAFYSDAQLDAAAAEFRRALHLKSDYVQADAALGDALLKSGNPAGALEEYRTALQTDSVLRSTLDSLSKSGRSLAGIATSGPEHEASRKDQ